MLNNQIFFIFYNLAHQSVFFDKLVIFFAQTFPYIVILTAILFLFFHRDNINSNFPIREFKMRIREVVLVFFSSGLAWFLSYIFKFVFHRYRPFAVLPNISSLFTEIGYAFPSGHATFFMALAFSLFFSHKKVGYIFMFFTLLIGLARIIAGVHFPIDILGGFILGIGIAYLIKYLYKASK